jgi:hypothetical protein
VFCWSLQRWPAVVRPLRPRSPPAPGETPASIRTVASSTTMLRSQTPETMAAFPTMEVGMAVVADLGATRAHSVHRVRIGTCCVTRTPHARPARSVFPPGAGMSPDASSSAVVRAGTTWTAAIPPTLATRRSVDACGPIRAVMTPTTVSPASHARAASASIAELPARSARIAPTASPVSFPARTRGSAGTSAVLVATISTAWRSAFHAVTRMATGPGSACHRECRSPRIRFPVRTANA